MVNKLDELYEQRSELERQLHVLDSKIDEEKKQEQREYKNICERYKRCFLKDIEIFNKEDIEREIKFGMILKTPHYIISFNQSNNFWKAEITDLHKYKFVASVCSYKKEIKTVKQALDNISNVIVEYEFNNAFAGVG